MRASLQNRLRYLIDRFRRDEEGATAIEYAQIASLTAVAVIPSWALMGEKLAGVFDTVSAALDGEPPGPPAMGGEGAAPPAPEEAPAPPPPP